MRSIISALLLCASTTLTSACLYKRQGEHAAWSYDGRTGPLLWHTLSPEWAICATGANQSPIDINSTIRTVTGSSFDYPSEADFTMLNNGHSVDSTPAAHEDATAFRATLGGEHYQLVGFHFHAPSEHKINGLAYPLEVHFVHRHVRTGGLAVFGIFFDITARQGDAFFLKMPFAELQEANDTREVDDINLSSIVKHVRSSRVFSYSGSLTTPPCSEQVSWFVAERPLLISVAQYNELRHAVGSNSRYTQGPPGEKNLLQQAEN